MQKIREAEDKEFCHRCDRETFRKQGKNGQRCCAECGTYDWFQEELSARRCWFVDPQRNGSVTDGPADG